MDKSLLDDRSPLLPSSTGGELRRLKASGVSHKQDLDVMGTYDLPC